jgi:hypothetical protein
MKNMQIDWNTRESKLDITFYYPEVNDVLTDKKYNVWDSSRKIMDNALMKHLKGTNIRWGCSSSTDDSNLMSSTLKLELRFKHPHKDISLRDINDILYNIDTEVQAKIKKLINRKS